MNYKKKIRPGYKFKLKDIPNKFGYAVVNFTESAGEIFETTIHQLLFTTELFSSETFIENIGNATVDIIPGKYKVHVKYFVNAEGDEGYDNISINLGLAKKFLGESGDIVILECGASKVLKPGKHVLEYKGELNVLDAENQYYYVAKLSTLDMPLVFIEKIEISLTK